MDKVNRIVSRGVLAVLKDCGAALLDDAPGVRAYASEQLDQARATVECMAEALEAMSADYNKALAIIAKHEGPVRSMLSDNAAAALRAYRGEQA